MDDEKATEAPIAMSDIADQLAPEVQAELKVAFQRIQELSSALAAALEARTELMRALQRKT